MPERIPPAPLKKGGAEGDFYRQKLGGSISIGKRSLCIENHDAQEDPPCPLTRGGAGRGFK
jgi:hypothetical protein